MIIHDLEVRNTTANGINADDGSDYANADASRFLIFRNLFIHDIGSGGNQDCLKLSRAERLLRARLSVRALRRRRLGQRGRSCRLPPRAPRSQHARGPCKATASSAKAASDDIEIRCESHF